MRALIVEEGHTRGALAGCRALARDGWHVGIGSPRRGLAGTSKSAAAWHRVPAVQDDLDAFLAEVAEVVSSNGYEVVFCSSDAEVFGLSLGRDRVAAIISYPAHDKVMRAFDNLELSRAARRAGMSAPKTVPAEDGTMTDFSLPAMVKSRLHWTPGA